MHFISEYLLYITKTISFLLLLFIFIAALLSLAGKNKQKSTSKLSIKKLNQQYESIRKAILKATASKQQLKQHKKAQRKQDKQKDKQPAPPRLFVIDFHGDIKAKATDALTQQINAILLSHEEDDEVLLRLESPGGIVPGYGLAAAQLARLRDNNIKLTVAIDKMAASGGYLMASVADYIIAAPLAIVGSIGVVAQLPNFNRLLDKSSVDFEQITAGQFKRTLSLFGKNTEEGRQKMQDEVNETLTLFKNHIEQYRPQVNTHEVATGEHWYASQALDLKLVDQLQTSDDFLLTAAPDKTLLQLNVRTPTSKLQKIIQSSLQWYQRSTNAAGCDYIDY